jgi:uncharacterized protein (TIGR03437 family)
LALSAGLSAQTVRFTTNLGVMDVQLLPESAPNTVKNFLNYVNRGDYNGSFFHRAVRNFVIQGGGYKWLDGAAQAIPEDAAVKNEFKVLNTRGTLAMAKISGKPDSATNQWFFNVFDNPTLNTTESGYTVFGKINDPASLQTMDRIAGLPVINAGTNLETLPVQYYTTGPVQERNLVILRAVTVYNTTPPPPVGPAIRDGLIGSAGAYGGLTTATNGSYIEIFGTKLGPDPGREWTSAEFNSGFGPTSVDGVTVTIAGVRAFVQYVSPTQLNVVVPDGVPTAGTVGVVVTFEGVTGTAGQLQMAPRAAGMLAPTSFLVNGRQYVVALRPDPVNKIYLGPSTIPGVTGPARAGETILLYGIGFGGVTPPVTSGKVASGSTSLTTPVEFRFGDTVAQVTYQGLAPGSVGLYQFNVVVPPGLPSGDIPVRVFQGGQELPQQLWLTIGN